MKRAAFLVLVLMVFLIACSGDKNNPGTDTVAPATPSNIKVMAGNARATVTWQLNAESDLKQYTLYWGGAADNLADSVMVEKAASSQTITGLTSERGNCYDNALAESFFATLKTEEVDGIPYETRQLATTSLFSYIETFYNSKRRHSSLNYLSPNDFEQLYWAKVA